MSEPKIPSQADNSTVPQSPAPQQENGPDATVRQKTSRPKPLPDWKPLGTVKDYFTEQMRQDSIHRY